MLNTSRVGDMTIEERQGGAVVPRSESWNRMVALSRSVSHGVPSEDGIGHLMDARGCLDFDPQCVRCRMDKVIAECEPTSTLAESMLRLSDGIRVAASSIVNNNIPNALMDPLEMMLKAVHIALEQIRQGRRQNSGAEPDRGVAKPS
jgi:hypothetical protein